MNLKVKGTINTSKKYAAGIVALGIGEDCGAFSEMLPYSLVYDLGACVPVKVPDGLYKV